MTRKAPKYIELYDILRKDIENGTYPPDSFLPTENELLELYQVSKTTIRHAVQLLREENLVEVRQGFGTRVLPSQNPPVPAPKFRAAGHQVSLAVTYDAPPDASVTNTKSVTDSVPASAECAKALGIREGDMVWRIQRIQRIDSKIFGYMVNYISMDLAPDLSVHGEITLHLYSHLEKLYGVRTQTSDEAVQPVIAGFKESQYLQVEAGTPLLMLSRTAKDPEGRPVEYCETVIRPDIFHLTIHTEYNT